MSRPVDNWLHGYSYILFIFLSDGVEGRSEHHFLTNTPPQNGYCFIYPTEGKVLQTFFQIKCPGWNDEDGHVAYKVYRGERLLQHGNQPVLTPLLLPLGSPEKNYAYELTVKIFDKYGSFSTEVLSVKVRRRVEYQTTILCEGCDTVKYKD